MQTKQIFCIQNKKCFIVCIDQTCNNYPFMCKETQCECFKYHSNCLTNMSWKLLKELLLSKAKHSTQMLQYKQNVKQIFMNIIADIQKSYNQFRYWAQTMALSKMQADLVRKIKNNQLTDLSGTYLYLIEKQLRTQKIFRKRQLENEKIKINEFTQKLLNKLKQLCKEQDKKIEINRINELNLKHQRDTINTEFKLIEKIQVESKIVLKWKKVIQLFGKLQKFNVKQNFIENLLSKTKYLSAISNLKLLYRASQNNFSIEEFHKKCDNIPNTLIILKTEFNKIIGGYTPLIWNKDNDGYQVDLNKQSFLFSITNDHIIPLVENTNAIYNRADNLIIFGRGYDLCIGDHANQKRNSSADIGYSYFSKQYPPNDKKSWQKFCGNDNGKNFKVIEWEVFQIYF